MKKISDALEEIISANQFLAYGLQNRLLNLTQLAKFLKPLVEARSKKELRSASALLMMLSRVQRERSKKVRKLERFKVKNITAYSNLAIYTFSKSQSFLAQLSKLYSAIEHRHSYMTLGQGTDEITLIVNESGQEELKRHISDKPKQHSRNIAALSIKYSEDYYNSPGMLYYLIQQVTLQGINIKEINSTYTEIVFYVDDRDLKLLFDTIYNQFVQ
jgi:aspartokinase